MTVCVRGDTMEKDFNMSAQVRVETYMQSLPFAFQLKSFEETETSPIDKSSLLLNKFAWGCIRLKCEMK